MRSIVVKSVVGLLGLILLLLFGSYIYLRGSLPDYDGTVSFAELNAPVTIVRDENAVPHIYASTPYDVSFAVGFVHAQDRLWQMEMNRRIAQGRLAEILGSSALGTDRFLRTLGVYERAKDALNSLTPETKAALNAYADGVNAFIRQHSGALPPEFVILGFEPEPWQPADTMGWFKMMAWDLGGNWSRELNRLDLLNILTPEELNEFYPPYRGDKAIAIPDINQLYDGLINVGDKTAFVEEPEPSVGSNNWVVGGSRTQSGKPLLANDPHLGFTTPSIWYLVHLNLGGKNIVGTTLPGSPLVVLGRNDAAAWGFTNTGPDVQDLFMEKISEDGVSYQTPNGWEPIVIREEVIKVKDSDDVILPVRISRHGPFISDVLPQTDAMLGDRLALAFRWTALDSEDTTVNIAQNLFTVRSFDEFVDNMSAYYVPEQNIVFANIDGEIGYYSPAKVPIRSNENDTIGRVPAPGWDARYDWQGYIPIDEMPKIHNPESDFVATANAKVVDDEYPHYLTSNWAYPYRTDRIVDLILATEKHAVATFAGMQADVFSRMADEFVATMLPAIVETNPDIYEAFLVWDRRMLLDRPEPLIYYSWHRMLAKRIYADELGSRFPQYWHLRAEFLYNVLTNKEGQGKWCDDVLTEEAETCDQQIALALNDALLFLAETNKGAWQSWEWGDNHISRHEHRPFTNVPVLSDIFDNAISVPGGPYTVNVNNIRTGSSRPFDSNHGASYRAIYDLADLDNSRYMIPVGQSGNPLSPYFDNLLDEWAAGRSFKISTDIEIARQNAIGELTLVPGNP